MENLHISLLLHMTAWGLSRGKVFVFRLRAEVTDFFET